MFSDLAGKRVLITGASKGIGLALVNRFLEEGSTVVGASRSGGPPSPDVPGPYSSVAVDVCDTDKVADWLTQEERAGRHFDVLINNAGLRLQNRLIDCSVTEFDQLFAVNTRAPFLLSQLMARHMKSREGGVIINAASFAASMPSVSYGVYAAAKAALVSLTRSMAAEWAPHGIRVNAYSPGVIPTEMTMQGIANRSDRLRDEISLRRFGEPAEVATAVLFLASTASAYLTGVNLEISGGKFAVQDPSSAWH